MPSASDFAFRLTSKAASRSSRRASALACSAICFAEAPSPVSLEPWMGMTPPVHELGDDHSHCERGRCDYERVRSARLFLLLLLRHGRLWSGRGRLHRDTSILIVGRWFAT